MQRMPSEVWTGWLLLSRVHADLRFSCTQMQMDTGCALAMILMGAFCCRREFGHRRRRLRVEWAKVCMLNTWKPPPSAVSWEHF